MKVRSVVILTSCLLFSKIRCNKFRWVSEVLVRMVASLGLSDSKVPWVNEYAASFGERRLDPFFWDVRGCERSSLNLVRLLMAGCSSVAGSGFINSLSSDQMRSVSGALVK